MGDKLTMQTQIRRHRTQRLISVSTVCLHNVSGTAAQLVARLIADPEVVSSIPARSHAFVETDNEIFSMAILLLPVSRRVGVS